MEFETFWKLYPRKLGKPQARKYWQRMSLEERQQALDVLPIYIRYVQASDYLQYRHGDVWLSKRTWEDREGYEQLPKQPERTEQATLADGQARGLTARPGESMEQYLQRIQQTRLRVVA